MAVSGINSSQSTTATSSVDFQPTSDQPIPVSTATSEEVVTTSYGPDGSTDYAAQTAGDLPTPPSGDDLAARAAYVESRLNELQNVFDHVDELESLAQKGDKKAQDLLNQLYSLQHEYEGLQEEASTLQEFMPDSDLDGDGVANQYDPDIDGDGLTNAYEKQIGTNAYDADSDHDGISDFGEVYLKKNSIDMSYLDPNNPDANNDGIVDGKELPSSIQLDEQGNPGTGDTGSTNSPANSIQWPNPSTDAQHIDASQGSQTISGTNDAVVNLNGGDVSFSQEGTSLVIGTSNGDIKVENYFDANGVPQRKLYLEGQAGNISTHNLSSNALLPVDKNQDGVSDGGIHFASSINTSGITSNIDPLNGSIPIDQAASTSGEMVYDANNSQGTFVVPQEINGQQVRAVDVEVDGNDVLVIAKSSPDSNQPLKVFRLKDAKDEVESFKIQFQLANNGQYFYSPSLNTSVIGGAGKDYITIKGGRAFGGDGNDILRATENAAILNGGQGDDILEGGAGVDTLIGGAGEGMDAAYSGTSEGDHFDMGDGDDIAIVSNTSTNANYDIKMGAGTDMSNYTNTQKIGDNSQASIDVRMDNLDGLKSFLAGQTDAASGALLEELQKATDLTDQGTQMAASSVRDAFLSFLSKKKNDQFADYGDSHSDTFGSSGDLPPPSDSGQ